MTGYIKFIHEKRINRTDRKESKVNFLWNGIKIDGKLYRVHYSDSKLLGNWPEGTLSIYRRDYLPMPEVPGLTTENDTDIMTDYFERDRIRITPGNPHYAGVKTAIEKYREHNRRISDKHWQF